MANLEFIEYGTCCACGKKPGRNLVTLDYYAPQPGTGWGCSMCGLPAEGA